MTGRSPLLAPETGGGRYTDSRIVDQWFHRPRWVTITEVDGNGPEARYGWKEIAFQENRGSGYESPFDYAVTADTDGGARGTPALNPVFDPNWQDLAVGTLVMVRPEFYHPTYDWVFSVAGSGSAQALSTGDFAKCLAATPTGGDGLYPARLQERDEFGKLLDTGESVWIREANLLTTLSVDYIYNVKRTGYANGRPVYTVEDFNLTVANQGLTQIVVVALYITYGPDTNWDITTSSDRVALVKRVFDIYEGSTERTTFTWRVTFDDTDFDVAATAVGHATINTNGFTGTRQNYRYCCVTGTLYEVSATVSVTRGLVKAWATMPTCP